MALDGAAQGDDGVGASDRPAHATLLEAGAADVLAAPPRRRLWRRTGPRQLVAFSANTTHHLDIGAATPGLIIDIPDVYAEGMLFAGTKLYEEGRRNEALWEDGGAGVWHLHKSDARKCAEAVESDIVADIR